MVNFVRAVFPGLRKPGRVHVRRDHLRAFKFCDPHIHQTGNAASKDQDRFVLFDADDALAAVLNSAIDQDRPTSAEKPLGQAMVGALGKTFMLDPGQETKVTFLVAWCFPNLPQHGNRYATRFTDAQAVAQYVADNFERLAGQMGPLQRRASAFLPGGSTFGSRPAGDQVGW